MPNGRDSNASAAIDYLIDDPVRTHAIRAEALETSMQFVSGFRIARKEGQRVFNRVDVRPVEIKEIAASTPR